MSDTTATIILKTNVGRYRVRLHGKLGELTTMLSGDSPYPIDVGTDIEIFSVDTLAEHEEAIRSDLRDQVAKLNHELKDARQQRDAWQKGIEEKVRAFIGYLTAAMPELHEVEVPRIRNVWEEFKARERKFRKQPPTETNAVEANTCSPDPRPGWGATAKSCGFEGVTEALNYLMTLQQYRKSLYLTSFWEEVYLKAFSGDDPMGTAARVADKAVEEHIQRFPPPAKEILARDIVAEIADKRVDSERSARSDSIIGSIGWAIRNEILLGANARWSDPDCCERRAVREVVKDPEHLGRVAYNAYYSARYAI